MRATELTAKRAKGPPIRRAFHYSAAKDRTVT